MDRNTARAALLASRPHVSPEFADAIALLAECAFKDQALVAADSEEDEGPFALCDDPTDPFAVALAYLQYSA